VLKFNRGDYALIKFDKNTDPNTLSSGFRRDVWWWAVGLVPPEASLTDEVRSKCAPDVLEGCLQWYEYFKELCADMYENEVRYMPASPRQYRDILEKIASGDDWEAFKTKINKSKAYVTAGLSLECRLKALERTGLIYKNSVFEHMKYPKIFHAMRIFQQSPNIRDTPARHHFAHCEFRQLFKNYNANHDELMRRASDESLFIAREIYEFCKEIKIQRYIHFGIIKYKYKNVRILDYNLYSTDYPTLRMNINVFEGSHATSKITMNPFKSDLDRIFKLITEAKNSIDGL
jgi:hypothetical protein